MDARFQASRLLQHAHPFDSLTPSADGILVGCPNLGQESRGLKACQCDVIDLVGLDPGICDRPHHTRVGDHHPCEEWPKQPLDRCGVADRLQHHLVDWPATTPESEDLVLHEIEALFTDHLAVVQDSDLGQRLMNVHSNYMLAPSPSVSGSWRVYTPSTDPRSQPRGAENAYLLVLTCRVQSALVAGETSMRNAAASPPALLQCISEDGPEPSEKVPT